MLLPCAVKRYGVPRGANPTRQLSLRPEAIGAVAKGKAAEAFDVEGHVGDLASVQAVTRVNAEQVSKDLMRKPTRTVTRGMLRCAGEASDVRARTFRRDIGDGMHTKEGRCNTGNPIA